MRLISLAIIAILALLPAGCTGRNEPRASPESPHASAALVDGRLDLPSMGVSLPKPRGWVQDPERLGSIGTLLIVRWLRPAPNDRERSIAQITLIAGNPKIRQDPWPLKTTPGHDIGGRPAVRLSPGSGTRDARPDADAAVQPTVVEGYRVDAHGMDFYLLHDSLDPATTRATFRAVADGVRWSRPVPAHRALALNGRRQRVWHDADLTYEVPDPFWNNPFRDEYQATSLADEAPGDDGDDNDENDDGDAAFEVHQLDRARDTAAALAAAAMPSYDGSRGARLAWRRISSDPEVHASDMGPALPEGAATSTRVKMIVARAPDGRYFRIGMRAEGPPAVLAAYDAIMNAVARSISTAPPPPVPHAPGESPDDIKRRRAATTRSARTTAPRAR